MMRIEESLKIKWKKCITLWAILFFVNCMAACIFVYTRVKDGDTTVFIMNGEGEGFTAVGKQLLCACLLWAMITFVSYIAVHYKFHRYKRQLYKHYERELHKLIGEMP